MNTFLGIVLAAVSVLTLAVVFWAFVWAAKKVVRRIAPPRSVSVFGDALD